MSSSCRTRSRSASPASSSRHCRPPRCAAPPRGRPTDLTAYDLYLRALCDAFFPIRQERILRGSGLARAGDRDAIRITGRHSPGRRSAIMRLVSDGWAEDPEADRRKGVDLARRALEVASDDPRHPRQRRLRAGVFRRGHRRHDRRWSTVRWRSTRASPAAGIISGILRLLAGQPDLAIEHVETSLRLSPREPHRRAALCDGRALFLQTSV